ncbi:MAG: hypothetical protein LH654_07660 [Thermoleophilia bacterium]|nr:hypothetical protein [Thermoleophilia bacterium]
MRDHAIDFAVPGEHESKSEPETMPRRLPRSESPDARRSHTNAPWLVVVLGRLQRYVVAKPLRLLMGIGMATDVDEQCGVVHDSALLLVQSDTLGESQRNQALPQNVLYRLAEPEVDP